MGTALVDALWRRPRSPDALSVAQALVDRGQFDEAIAYARAENRRVRNPALERELVKWRRQAFSSVDLTRRRSTWPPSFPDPFPGNVTVPELPMLALDVASLGGGITHHGALIVRGLFCAAEAKSFADGIDEAMRVRSAAAGSSGENSWYSPFPLPNNPPLSHTRKTWVENSGAMWAADSPRLLFDLIEILDHKGVIALVASYFGERPALSVGKCTLRRVPASTGTDWHQDGAFLGSDIRTVNMWVALSECGIDAPGLDMVPRRLPNVVATGTHGATFDWSVGPAMVDQVTGDRPIVTPHFQAGDAIFFDQLFLHRTGVRPSMVRDRWAIESWFFAPSSYPMEQEPLLI
jgi:hypothetical protein